MRVLVDTNLLARLIHTADPQHQLAVQAIARLRATGNELVIVPQCLYEFWVIATRPVKDNGFGFTIPHTVNELARVRQVFTLLPDTPAILPEWERLVTTHAVIGKTAHDARLVAAMIVHGIGHVLTFNVRHFQQFPGITTLTPAAVLPPPP